MDFIGRLSLWSAVAIAVVTADVMTKAIPHADAAYNYTRTPVPVFVAVGLFLCLVMLRHSPVVALGSGLMFGGLLGNAGQLLIFGYATDWIPLGGFLTNVADLCGGAGLVCCCAGYGVSAFSRRRSVAGRDPAVGR